MASNQLNRSFFVINDTRLGWGETAFFSFFVQVQRESPTMRYAEIAVLAITMILGWAENLLVTGVLLSLTKLRKPANYFIVNLSLSSAIYLTCGGFVISARLYDDWITGAMSCRFTYYIVLVSGIVGLWTQALIGVERYRKILKPASHQFKERSVIAACAGVWIINLSAIYPMYHYSFTVEVPDGKNGTVTICTVGMPYNETVRLSYIMFTYIMILGYIVPLLVTIVCYIKILRRVRSSYTNLKRHASTMSTKSDLANGGVMGGLNPKLKLTFATTSNEMSKEDESSSSGVRLKQRFLSVVKRESKVTAKQQRHRKTVSVLLGLLLVFFTTWISIFVTIAVIQIEHDSDAPQISSDIFIWALILTFTNACLNPVLYGFVNQNFKIALREVRWVKKRFGKEVVSNSIVSSSD